MIEHDAAWDATIRLAFGYIVVVGGQRVGGFALQENGVLGVALFVLVSGVALLAGAFVVVQDLTIVLEAAIVERNARLDSMDSDDGRSNATAFVSAVRAVSGGTTNRRRWDDHSQVSGTRRTDRDRWHSPTHYSSSW